VNRIQLKVCGVATEADLRVLDDALVDYAGLWFHMPRGTYSLDRPRFLELCSQPRSRLACVAVTTHSDPEAIASFLRGSRVAAVQLHGFLLPGALRRLRRSLAEDVELFKVLHVKDDECFESSLIRAYADSGADAFVLDRYVSSDRLGSTGQRIPNQVLESLVAAIGCKRVFVAGGVSPENVGEIASRFGIRGVDLDSSVRRAGQLDQARVRALVGAVSIARARG